MGKCGALYQPTRRLPAAQTEVELDRERLVLSEPQGKRRTIELVDANFQTRDATCHRRFVRELRVGHREVVLSTPPVDGAIAPRALRLPQIPDTAVFVATKTWHLVVEWLKRGRRLASWTIEELASLVRMVSPSFALVVGEWAATIAVGGAAIAGPHRGGADAKERLRPLALAAADDERAHDAFLAAMAKLSA